MSGKNLLMWSFYTSLIMFLGYTIYSSIKLALAANRLKNREGTDPDEPVSI